MGRECGGGSDGIIIVRGGMAWVIGSVISPGMDEDDALIISCGRRS